MDNKLKSKTRLTNIQLIFQHISTNDDIDVIRENFDKYYKNSSIENFSSKKKIKFEFNTNFLIKLNNYYKEYVNLNDYLIKINSFITIDRKFEKWNLINQSIILAAISELINTEESKLKIVLNDYLNISKNFISLNEVKIINAILDKFINEKKK
jgi:transcription termination factor NusB